MELDITDFFANAEPAMFSASRAELGNDAGDITWRAAVAEGSASPLLVTPEQVEAFREYMREYGAWDDDERAAWSNDECNALLIQSISGDMREIESLCVGDDGEVDWSGAYERLRCDGTIGGNIYRGDDGRIYYYIGI